MDPVTTALLAGAAGGAAKQLVEGAWRSGGSLITSRFRHYDPRAQQEAEANIDPGRQDDQLDQSNNRGISDSRQRTTSPDGFAEAHPEEFKHNQRSAA